MNWISRLRHAGRVPQDRSTHTDDGGLTFTVGGSCQGVMIGDGSTQVNSFGPDAGDDWGERDEDPSMQDWYLGDEVDDEGGMSEIDPRADEVARQEWQRDFGPELGR